MEVKLAPEGRFVAERDIAPGTLGFDALTVKMRSLPIDEASELGTASIGGLLTATATFKTF